MCVCSVASNFCKSMDCSPPGSSFHRIFLARILEWVGIASSRGSAPPRDQTCRTILTLRVIYIFLYQNMMGNLISCFPWIDLVLTLHHRIFSLEHWRKWESLILLRSCPRNAQVCFLCPTNTAWSSLVEPIGCTFFLLKIFLFRINREMILIR